MKPFVQARPVVESGFRDAIALENDIFRVVVDLEGGMIPELSRKRGKSFINAHWIPWFRGMTPVSEMKEGKAREPFQKVGLLERIAGNFPCVPSFGGGAPVNGVEIPAHGWTANNRWELVGAGADEENGCASARFWMVSPSDRMRLEFEKTDLVFARESVHYTVLKIKNSGAEAVSINAAWHNTVGFPFLTKGCRISASAGRWSIPLLGGEFDATGRLAVGGEFANLKQAPTRAGETVDISGVPGMIGYTDFITGPVPEGAALGWSACVNSELSLAYVTWFPGPEAVRTDEIGLCFNNFWMQYGGRPFAPWAMYEGAPDQTFCLGMENSIGAWANGLAESIARKELLGRPTTLQLRAGEEKTLLYATGLFDLGGKTPDGPVTQIEPFMGGLRLKFDHGVLDIEADGNFERLRRMAERK